MNLNEECLLQFLSQAGGRGDSLPESKEPGQESVGRRRPRGFVSLPPMVVIKRGNRS